MVQKTVIYFFLMTMALSPVISGTDVTPNKTENPIEATVSVEAENMPPPVDDYLENPLLRLQEGTGYSSKDYSEIARGLSSRYPEILTYKTIGYSRDGKEIYSIVMSENVKTVMNRDDFNTFRMHYLIDAGVHGRETVNPAIVLKQIEDYAADYYKDSHIEDFNLRDVLSKSVFHFVPLVNPDGHDLSKFGPDSVLTSSLKDALANIDDKDYSRWKANIAGVDLNKNFPDFHLQDGSDGLTDKWQVHPGNFLSSRPAGEYYPGVSPGSEPETKALMEYMKNFDFRSYVSYHSRGNVVYYEYKWYPQSYRDKALILAQATNEVTGYRLIPDTGEGSGYSTSYHAALSLKPSLTIETLPYNTALPSGNRTYLDAYEKTWLLPLHYQRIGEKTGYFTYRLYVDGKYVRDYPDEAYARAIAGSLGGEIIQGEGVPEQIISK